MLGAIVTELSETAERSGQFLWFKRAEVRWKRDSV